MKTDPETGSDFSINIYNNGGGATIFGEIGRPLVALLRPTPCIKLQVLTDSFTPMSRRPVNPGRQTQNDPNRTFAV